MKKSFLIYLLVLYSFFGICIGTGEDKELRTWVNKPYIIIQIKMKSVTTQDGKIRYVSRAQHEAAQLVKKMASGIIKILIMLNKNVFYHKENHDACLLACTNLYFNYLRRFGYYDDNTRRNDIEYTKEGLRELQSFAGLKSTGIVDAKTRDLFEKPRCSNPDHAKGKRRRKKRYVLQGTKWMKLHLTWRIFGRSRTLTTSIIRDVIHTALSFWSTHTNLRFEEVFEGEPDIAVRFYKGFHFDPYPFDGKGGSLAHAFYPHTNEYLSGDVHFDYEEEFTVNSHLGRNFLWVATHEIGHSLGLEHSNVQDAVMFPWYQKYRPGFDLTEDDILGIQALYGRKGEIPEYLHNIESNAIPTIKIPSTNRKNKIASTDHKNEVPLTIREVTSKNPKTNIESTNPKTQTSANHATKMHSTNQNIDLSSKLKTEKISDINKDLRPTSETTTKVMSRNINVTEIFATKVASILTSSKKREIKIGTTEDFNTTTFKKTIQETSSRFNRSNTNDSRKNQISKQSREKQLTIPTIPTTPTTSTTTSTTSTTITTTSTTSIKTGLTTHIIHLTRHSRTAYKTEAKSFSNTSKPNLVNLRSAKTPRTDTNTPHANNSTLHTNTYTQHRSTNTLRKRKFDTYKTLKNGRTSTTIPSSTDIRDNNKIQKRIDLIRTVTSTRTIKPKTTIPHSSEANRLSTINKPTNTLEYNQPQVDNKTLMNRTVENEIPELNLVENNRKSLKENESETNDRRMGTKVYTRIQQKSFSKKDYFTHLQTLQESESPTYTKIDGSRNVPNDVNINGVLINTSLKPSSLPTTRRYSDKTKQKSPLQTTNKSSIKNFEIRSKSFKNITQKHLNLPDVFTESREKNSIYISVTPTHGNKFLTRDHSHFLSENSTTSRDNLNISNGINERKERLRKLRTTNIPNLYSKLQFKKIATPLREKLSDTKITKPTSSTNFLRTVRILTAIKTENKNRYIDYKHGTSIEDNIGYPKSFHEIGIENINPVETDYNSDFFFFNIYGKRALAKLLNQQKSKHQFYRSKKKTKTDKKSSELQNNVNKSTKLAKKNKSEKVNKTLLKNYTENSTDAKLKYSTVKLRNITHLPISNYFTVSQLLYTKPWSKILTTPIKRNVSKVLTSAFLLTTSRDQKSTKHLIRSVTPTKPTSEAIIRYKKPCPKTKIIARYYNTHAKYDVIITEKEEVYFAKKGRGLMHGPFPGSLYYNSRSLPQHKITAVLHGNVSPYRSIKTFVFTGNAYYVYDHFYCESGPHSIYTTDNPLGVVLPQSVKNIEAAMLWNVDNMVYLFSDIFVWVYDQNYRQLHDNNPRLIQQMWPGLPRTIDSAYSSQSKHETYFTKGHLIYKINDSYNHVTEKYHIGREWLKCGSSDEWKTLEG